MNMNIKKKLGTIYESGFKKNRGPLKNLSIWKKIFFKKLYGLWIFFKPKKRKLRTIRLFGVSI